MPLESNKRPSIKDPQVVSPDFLSPLILEQIFKFIYPVGSYYFNKTDSRSPNEIFGIGCGTWVAETARVLVGKNSSGTFSTLGSTGGSETHTLSVAEMPSHKHDIYSNAAGGTTVNDATFGGINGFANLPSTYVGGGGAHNNLQPYVTVMMWYRTA